MAGLSPGFLLFALIVVSAFNLSRHPVWKRGVLLAASLVFIAILNPSPVALIPLLSFTVFGYLCLRWILAGHKTKLWAISSIILLLFVWLKRYAILPPSILLPFPYLTLGLSYILFRVLHVVIDACNVGMPEAIGFTRYLSYTLNFTTFISGPIQRFGEFDEMLGSKRPERLSPSSAGAALERAAKGIFKVRVLSSLFSLIQQHAVLNELHTTGDLNTRVLQGAILFPAYTFFLYCNFSGYIDVMIGIARLLGIRLPENFDRPFSSTSFIEFWSRWHITLSGWLKDYLYLPMVSTLLRRFPQRSLEPYLGVVAYFVTFFVVGIWHGQTSVFLFFGLLQGGGVGFNKLFEVYFVRYRGRKAYRKFSANAIWCTVSRGLTFTWFTFTLTWFWSDWRQIGELYSALGPGGAVLAWTLILAVFTLALALWEAIHQLALKSASRWEGLFLSRYSRTAWTTALVVTAVAFSVLLNQPVPEIVYGKF